MFETTNQLFLYIIFPIGDDPSDLMFISFSLQRFRKVKSQSSTSSDMILVGGFNPSEKY